MEWVGWIKVQLKYMYNKSYVGASARSVIWSRKKLVIISLFILPALKPLSALLIPSSPLTSTRSFSSYLALLRLFFPAKLPIAFCFPEIALNIIVIYYIPRQPNPNVITTYGCDRSCIKFKTLHKL